MRTMIYLSLGVLYAVITALQQSNTSARTFSTASLKGTCIWQEVKYPSTGGSQQNVGPATVMASIDFDGRGAMTLDYDANINGTYSSTNGVPGVYYVDSTGHGSFTFTSPASTFVRTYDFRISTNGRTIYTMTQADGTGTVSQRVSAGSCAF